MKIFQKAGFISMLVALMMTGSAVHAAPAEAVDLGEAEDFAIVTAGEAGVVNNIGATTITGDVGTLLPVVGFDADPDIVTFEGDDSDLHVNDAEALAAAAAVVDAYNAAVAQPDAEALEGTADQLSDVELEPGLYSFESDPGALNLIGTLTLDAENDPNAVWVFQTTGDFNTDTDSEIILENGAQSDNVFWQIGGAAALGEGSDFVGTLLANGQIFLGNGAEVRGRLLSVTDSVLLENNEIDVTNLASALEPDPTPVTPIPLTPGLPATGFGPVNTVLPSILFMAGAFGIAALVLSAIHKKQ